MVHRWEGSGRTKILEEKEMSVVHKYNLMVGVINNISLPAGSKVLTVKAQRDEICMWALMGNGPSANHRFFIVGTGHSFHQDIKDYIGTVMSRDHTFVFHVFEVM